MLPRLAPLALAVALLSGIASSSLVQGTEVDVRQLQEEIRFRQDFGLRSDEAYVRERMADPSAYDRWPAALTTAESAEMDRRQALETEMEPLEDLAESMPGFAGHWVDQPAGGIITVAFYGGTEVTNVQKLQDLTPQGAELRIVDARFPLSDLRSVDSQISHDVTELAREGIELAHWGVDVSENRVKVGVIGLDKTKAGALQERYGGRIVVLPADPQPTGCTGRETCIGPPLRGGISGAPGGTSYRNRCSIAFMIHYGSKWQWLTAGHCAQATGVTWYQGANWSWAIGTIKKTCWPQCNYPDAARAGNLSATYASNNVYLNQYGLMRSISARQGFNADDEGDLTCLNARRVSGSYSCGYIDHIGTINYPGGIYYLEMRFATYASMYGDSGGAVHSGVTSQDTFVAYGVQSGCTNMGSDDVCYGLSVYSHIYRVLQEVGGSICKVSNPCP